MTINVIELTRSIAAAPISGVAIFDATNIPDVVDDREQGVLFPEPVNFFQNPKFTVDTYGTNDIRSATFEYDLLYTFCYRPAGADRPLALYGPMLETTMDILDTLMALELSAEGAVEFVLAGVSSFGVVSDPGGFQHIGCQLTFHVTEFIR